MKNNLLLMEISHVVPTILGVPMKIALNGSAVVTVDMNAKVEAKNLIFGTKTVIVNGNIKPRYVWSYNKDYHLVYVFQHIFFDKF